MTGPSRTSNRSGGGPAVEPTQVSTGTAGAEYPTSGCHALQNRLTHGQASSKASWSDYRRQLRNMSQRNSLSAGKRVGESFSDQRNRREMSFRRIFLQVLLHHVRYLPHRYVLREAPRIRVNRVQSGLDRHCI